MKYKRWWIFIHTHTCTHMWFPQIFDSLNESSLWTFLFTTAVKLSDHKVAFNINTWENPAIPAWASDQVTYKSLLPSFSSTNQPKITSHHLSINAINFLTFTLFISDIDLQVFLKKAYYSITNLFSYAMSPILKEAKFMALDYICWITVSGQKR